MRFRDLLYETWAAITANRGRTMLTVIGIVIGISAVISVTALIGGIQQSLISEFGLSQSRLIYIQCMPNRAITRQDVTQIATGLPDYEYLTGTVVGSSTLVSDKKQYSAMVNGVETKYFSALGSKLKQGRFFTDGEVTSGSMEIVLDQNGVKQLYGDSDEQVVGKTVHIGNDDYSIVGVIEASSAFVDTGITVYMPINTVVTRITGTADISQMLGVAKDGVDVETLADETTDYLVDYFHISEADKENTVFVQSMKSVVDQVNVTMSTFQILMALVAGISLLVGGVGIMNMMLTNVTERIREIGLRKALGARASDITRQFLLESVMVCLAGGIIGIALGYLFSWVLAIVASGMINGLTSISPVISPTSVVTAAGICVAIGVVFGFYPARRAAKLDPVESLHYQ